MFCYGERLPKNDFAKGVKVQVLGSGKNLNVLHWDMADGSIVPPHQHPQEQFGYVLKGGFRMTIGEESAELKAGDCYFIPANAPHNFVAVGQTEAIDVFSPVRPGLPGAKPSKS
jgi:quercetin dioxygenase-like cupin family protein